MMMEDGMVNQVTVKQFIKIVGKLTDAANYCRSNGKFEAEAILRNHAIEMTLDLLRAERKAIGAN